MKPDWKDFLSDAGAEFDERGIVASFGNSERELRVVTAGKILCDLSHLGLISAHGADTQTFLQGQLTNDVRQVNEKHSQLTAYCNPKGRMLAIMRLFQRDDTYYLQLPETILEPILKRLRMFVMRSEVDLEDASDALVRIGVSGPGVDGDLREALGGAPEHENDVMQQGDLTVMRIPGPHPRFEIAGELDAIRKLWDQLNVRAAPVGTKHWGLLDILAGVPSVNVETSEAFVPQMANLELVNGVSFQKGCYTGQEVVARSQYLGKLKRRMYRAHVDSDETPTRGAELFDATDKSGQAAGKIVEVQTHPDGGFELLAVVQIGSAAAGALHLGAADGPSVELRELPYAFEKGATNTA